MKKGVLVAVSMVLLTVAGVAYAQRMSVQAKIANVRSGPSTSDPVIWQVERYHPLKVVQKQGRWYLFEDFEGDRGWIHESLLSKTEAVVVKKNKCNVRSGPGTANDIRFTVDKGVPFKVIAKQGQWLHVVHADGDKGWIHRSLVW